MKDGGERSSLAQTARRGIGCLGSLLHLSMAISVADSPILLGNYEAEWA